MATPESIRLSPDDNDDDDDDGDNEIRQENLKYLEKICYSATFFFFLNGSTAVVGPRLFISFLMYFSTIGRTP
jgi:hypothetical protein